MKLTNLFKSNLRNKDDLQEILNQAHDKHLVDDDTFAMLEGALGVSLLQVRDVMIPRSQVVKIESSQEPTDFMPLIIKEAHSRYPVFNDRNEIEGILLAKDLLPLTLNKDFNWRDQIRKPFFVPEIKPIQSLLKEFRTQKHHIAIVVDEYGSMGGIVTIEDVLEQIVGEISDEHDDEQIFVKLLPNGNFLLNALIKGREFNDYFGTDLDDESTISSTLIKKFKKVPKRGESIEIGTYQFHILSADSFNIHLIRLILGKVQ